MIDSGKLKVGVTVVLLLAVLAGFDAYSGHSSSKITGASVVTDSGSGGTATDCQFDLSAYPCMFGYANGNDFDGVIVVGDQAASSDVIGSVEISSGLKNYFSGSVSAKVASEVASPTARKVISVGGACVNSVTAEWLGNPADCTAGLKEGKAVIKLIKHPNGQIGVIVMGYSATDLRRAARVLANYKKWQDAWKLRGNEVIVTGTGLSDGSIAVFESEKSFNPNAGGGLYSGLTYTCYSGAGGGVATSGNCIGYDEIRQSAELGCLGHCTTSGTSKCGVNNLKFTPCTATDQTAKCPSTITVSSNKQTAYLQGETAVFTITMRDAAGNIVKRGASLGISSATETPSLMFGKAFSATDSGIVTVEVPLTASIYQPGGYAVQVSSEAGDCDYVSGGQSLAVQAATDQTALPDINVTEFKELSGAASVKYWFVYAVNNTNGDADVVKPFRVVTRLNGGVIRNILLNELKRENTGTLLPATGFVDSFLVEESLLKCVGNTIEVSADDSNAIAEKYEFNNKRSITVKCANTLTLKADSFSAVALGAAFGSYYEPGRSTCDPDNLFLLAWVSAPSLKYYEDDEEPVENSYENVLLFDLDEDTNELKVKPKETGHKAAMAKATAASYAANRIKNMSTTEAAGAWILNNGPECQLAFSYDDASVKDIGAFSGIRTGTEAANFISVVPQMIGRNLSVVSDSNFWDPYSPGAECKIFAAYSNFNNGATRTWETIDPVEHVFAPSELGMGMWVFALDRLSDRDHCALRLKTYS